jgi:FixJ family two-component response regulator
MTLPEPPEPLVLVVAGDTTLRQLVGWIVAEMDFCANLVASWHEALTLSSGSPGCIVADHDDIGNNDACVLVLRKCRGGAVPLVVLSRHAGVVDWAERLGAVAVVHKPINVGTSVGTFGRSVAKAI